MINGACWLGGSSRVAQRSDAYKRNTITVLVERALLKYVASEKFFRILIIQLRPFDVPGSRKRQTTRRPAREECQLTVSYLRYESRTKVDK